jgi:hypothetical protein
VIDAARFWKHVVLLDDSRATCWLWVGAMRDDGRGRFLLHGRKEIRAHWAAYEIQHGHPPIPGHRLEQTCGNPNCVRHWKQGGPVRKLNEQATAAIRASRIPGRELARRYRIAEVHVRRLKAGRTDGASLI